MRRKHCRLDGDRVTQVVEFDQDSWAVFRNSLYIGQQNSLEGQALSLHAADMGPTLEPHAPLGITGFHCWVWSSFVILFSKSSLFVHQVVEMVLRRDGKMKGNLKKQMHEEIMVLFSWVGFPGALLRRQFVMIPPNHEGTLHTESEWPVVQSPCIGPIPAHSKDRQELRVARAWE